MALATDLLWLREPARRTALAKVTAHRGPAFLLDRSIFHATSHEHRHPQPADRGEVWIGGDKRILTRSFWDRGELRHVVRGTVPPMGAEVRCLLDADRREDSSAAHAALHLVLSQFARRRLGTLVGEPRVQGGRQFSLGARFAAWSAPVAKELLDAAEGARAAGAEVSYEFLPRDALHGVDAQPFEDGTTVPGSDPTLRIVRLGPHSALPCDGTFPARLASLGRITLRRAAVARGVVQLQFHVARAPR